MFGHGKWWIILVKSEYCCLFNNSYGTTVLLVIHHPANCEKVNDWWWLMVHDSLATWWLTIVDLPTTGLLWQQLMMANVMIDHDWSWSLPAVETREKAAGSNFLGHRSSWRSWRYHGPWAAVNLERRHSRGRFRCSRPRNLLLGAMGNTSTSGLALRLHRWSSERAVRYTMLYPRTEDFSIYIYI